VFYDTTKNEKSIFKTFIAGNKRLRVWKFMAVLTVTLKAWTYIQGCSLARAVQGGAPVLFWMPGRCPVTAFKGSDVKYKRRILRAWVRLKYNVENMRNLETYVV
jgi:hypothetical protein